MLRHRALALPTLAACAAPAINVVAQAVAARALGPTAYGQVALALALVALVVVFVDVTYEEALLRMGAEALHERDVPRLRRLFRWGLVVDATVMAVVVCALALGGDQLNSAILNGESTARILLLAGLAGVLTTLDGTTATMLLLLGRPHQRVYLQFLGGCLRLTVLLLLLRDLDPEDVLVALLAGNAAASALLAGSALLRLQNKQFRDAPRPARTPAARSLAGSAARLSLTATTATAASAASAFVAPLALGRLEGAAAVGQFTVGFLPLIMLGVVTVPVRNLLMRRDSADAAAGGTALMRRDLQRLKRALQLGSGPVVVLLSGLLVVILPLVFGSAYRDAGRVAAVVVFALPCYAYVSYCKSVAVACGAGGIRTRAAVRDLLTALAVLPCMVVLAGLWGAAVGVVLVSAVVALSWGRAARRSFDSVERRSPQFEGTY